MSDDVLDFDNTVKDAGPLRARHGLLYFAPRGDYPDKVITAGPYLYQDDDQEIWYASWEDACWYDEDAAVEALRKEYLRHVNRPIGTK